MEGLWWVGGAVCEKGDLLRWGKEFVGGSVFGEE